MGTWTPDQSGHICKDSSLLFEHIPLGGSGRDKGVFTYNGMEQRTTIRELGRKEVVSIQSNGPCTWKLYEETYHRGKSFDLNGRKDNPDFTPRSFQRICPPVTSN